MSAIFKSATREQVGLLIGLAGVSGGGKTFSAFRLASGISGDKPFAVIDTENRRALHYADQFKFDHCELREPFIPDAYAEAIAAADAADYPVIIVDSASHEWSGDGGCLDMQDAELDRMAGNDWKKREACKMAAWIKPKMAHKKMVSKLLQVKAHLVLCFRAEPKIEMMKIDGKMVIQEKQSLTGLNGYIPISEKNLPFELTASFLLTPDAPGIPKPIKLQEQHRAMFPLDKPINEETGRKIAEWARGGSAKPSITFHEVLSEIEKIQSKKDGQRIVAMVDGLSEDDKNAARKAYKARLLALEGSAKVTEEGQYPILPKGPLNITAEFLLKRFQSTRDVDVLDADATLIETIADVAMREDLSVAYKAKRNELVGM